MRLDLGAPVHGGAFFRAVVLPAQPTRELLALRRIASDAPRRGEARETPAFDPHLSLVYGELPEARRQALTRELAPLAGVCRFDRVQAVRPGLGTEGWRPVASWRIVGTRDLTAT